MNLLFVSISRSQHRAILAVLSAAALVEAHSAAFGCSECGCSLSSDWASQGNGMRPGLQAGVRFEYYNNTDLRSGRHHADRASFSFPNDREIQQETLNHNTWVDLDYVVNSSWAVSAQIPFYERFHSTIAPGDTAISDSRSSGLGDMRILARYQKFDPAHGFSFQFGFKLPTGHSNQNFSTGPLTGSLLDRGLQLGSGTTDIVAGGSYFWRPDVHLGFFLQTTAVQPVAYRDAYLPSANLNFNAGVRYLNTSWLTPQLQLNVRWDGREHGAAADVSNSGDTLAFLSPGVTAELGVHASAFVFVQLPVYQRVNGLQLEPHWILSIGVRYQFH